MNNIRYRGFDVAIIVLACCAGALALGGMLFMLSFFTGQMQNMVGIVYESDAAAAQELLSGMFTGADKAESGLAAAEALGYTADAFRLWNRVNIYGMIAVFAAAAALIACGIAGLLLNTARLRAGKIHFNKKKMDIASIADRLELENDGLVVEAVPSCLIDADAEWLYQAVKNIVVNGLEYGKVTLKGGCTDEMVSFEITDEGPGVKKSEMARMFDRYYVGEDSRRDSTGIGLNLAYMVVRAHGGDIVVHSAEGDTGCTIKISIPRYNVKEKIKISDAVRVL